MQAAGAGFLCPMSQADSRSSCRQRPSRGRAVEVGDGALPELNLKAAYDLSRNGNKKRVKNMCFNIKKAP